MTPMFTLFLYKDSGELLVVLRMKCNSTRCCELYQDMVGAVALAKAFQGPLGVEIFRVIGIHIWIQCHTPCRVNNSDRKTKLKDIQYVDILLNEHWYRRNQYFSS